MLLCVSSVFAKGPHHAKIKAAMKEVGLSDQQIKQIEEIHFDAEREKIDIEHDIKNARLDLKQLLAADKPNKSKIFDQLKRISDIELKMKYNRVGTMLKVRSLMKKEQWEKLELLRAKHKKGRMGRGKHGKRHGPGQGHPMGMGL
jgi:Spy/CpxP family protein refolding chaperone